MSQREDIKTLIEKKKAAIYAIGQMQDWVSPEKILLCDEVVDFYLFLMQMGEKYEHKDEAAQKLFIGLKDDFKGPDAA